jgi:uncharacterized cofD-like protein
VNVVGIGGGHGLSRALAAVQIVGEEPTAVVTVADDGGSSGRLRDEHGVVALGDLRMALFTLARNADLAPVFEHRFSGGDLKGHAVGNLLLLALLESCDGDLVTALDRAAAMLQCGGRVLPATAAAVQLRAQVGDEHEEVDGQVQVATAAAPVRRVWLEPSAPEACAEAVDAISAADVVLLGPGSLFTSILAALLVPGIADAVTTTKAAVVLIGNLLTQPGETSEFDGCAHVDALVSHVPGLRLDAVVLHDGPDVTGFGKPLGTDLQHDAVDRLVCADLALRGPDGSVTGQHDPQRLADAIRPLLGR